MDDICSIDAWIDCERMVDLGHTKIGIYIGNIPQECEPLGDSFSIVVSKKLVYNTGLDIERAIRERVSPPGNSYMILGMSSFMSEEDSATNEIQAYNTDREWLRNRWKERGLEIERMRRLTKGKVGVL